MKKTILILSLLFLFIMCGFSYAWDDGGWSDLKLSYTKRSTAPTVNDDNFGVPYIWVDTSVDPNQYYMLMDNTPGAADWEGIVGYELAGLTNGVLPYKTASGLDDSPLARVDATTLSVTGADPAFTLIPETAVDTRFWMGNINDADGVDDDVFQLGKGTTPGTDPFVTVDKDGNVGIGTTPTSKLTVDAGDIEFTTAGQYGLKWPGGSRLLELTVAEGGSDRMIYRPNGSWFDILNEAGSFYLAKFKYNQISLFTGATETSTTERLRIDSAGQVGIGTTSPSTKLNIAGTTMSTGDAAVTSFAGTVSSSGTTVTFSSAADAILAGYSATNPVIGTTLISDGQTLYITEWTDATNAVTSAAASPALSSDTITSTQFPISVEYASDGSLAKIVNAAGNVGIGTTNPLYLLSLFVAGASGEPRVTFQNDDTGSTIHDGLHVGMDNTENMFIRNKENTELSFWTNDARRVTISNGGNVGIGTTSPDAKLHNELDSAATNAATEVTRTSLTSIGTPAAGLGPEQVFEVETAAGDPGNMEVIAGISGIATDVTSTSEDGAIVFKTMSAGATRTEKFRVNSTGIAVTPNTTTASPTTYADDATITVTHGIMRVAGDGAAKTLDTDPAISDGTYDGQMLIIQGSHDTNTLTIADACNTALAGDVSMVLGLLDTLTLMWDDGQSTWVETSRSAN